jgi:hypothetical protein
MQHALNQAASQGFQGGAKMNAAQRSAKQATITAEARKAFKKRIRKHDDDYDNEDDDEEDEDAMIDDEDEEMMMVGGEDDEDDEEQ